MTRANRYPLLWRGQPCRVVDPEVFHTGEPGVIVLDTAIDSMDGALTMVQFYMGGRRWVPTEELEER